MAHHVDIDPSKLALQRLYHWEATQGQRQVLVQPMGGGQVQHYTWAGLMGEARRVAAWLKAQGVQPGDRVALMSKNCAWWLMADFAIWMAGGVSVPLYPTLAADTIRQILLHSGAKLLFIGKLDGWSGMKPGVTDAQAAAPGGIPCVRMPLAPDASSMPAGTHEWSRILADTAPLAGQPVRDGDELCTIMYTSGTTGMPKGVMHSFGTFAWSIEAGLSRGAMDGETRVLSYLPLSHVAERTLVEHGLLSRGNTVTVYFAESLDTFAQDLQRARPTAFFSVPRLWVKFQQGVNAKMPPAKLERLLKIPIVGSLVRRKVLTALGLDQCRFAAGGAAPMPTELLNWYARLGLPIIEVYGMTENCGVSHATLPGVQRPGTVGLTYDGVQSRIDPASGEIQVRTPGNMLGYYREPELTKQAFTDDGWLHTGDQGALDAEGNLRITGRVKDLFKTSKGKYVAPAPIEDKLGAHPAVEACCVTGANLGQPLGLLMLNAEATALVRNGARADLEAQLAAHLQGINALLDPHERLDCVAVVTEAWTVDNGFITPTFKVKRNRVEEVYSASYERWTETGRKVVWL